jgi:hypothetical protein
MPTPPRVCARGVLLLGEVERTDPRARRPRCVVEQVGWDDPHHLELEAVRILAYRLFVVPWSLAPTRAPTSKDTGDPLQLGQSVDLHARWYRPTVLRPACESAAAAPMAKRPRSWSFVDPGACRKAARPGVP